MSMVVGLGFRPHTTGQALRQALVAAERTAQRRGPHHVPFEALATAADKHDHPALSQLATELGVPVVAVALAQLRAQDAQPSHYVPARYGAHSLAEAAALAAAGEGAVLVAQRHISTDGTATAAIALKFSPQHST